MGNIIKVTSYVARPAKTGHDVGTNYILSFNISYLSIGKYSVNEAEQYPYKPIFKIILVLHFAI